MSESFFFFFFFFFFFWGGGGVYALSTVFQLFNHGSSQIHVSWTIFNHYLTSPLSGHWKASRSVIVILSKGEMPLIPVFKTLVCRGQESNPRLPTHKVDTLTTTPLRWSERIESILGKADQYYQTAKHQT